MSVKILSLFNNNASPTKYIKFKRKNISHQRINTDSQ